MATIKSGPIGVIIAWFLVVGFFAVPGAYCWPAGPQLVEPACLVDLRRLSANDPHAAFEMVERLIAKDRSNLVLQRFRWYLAYRTARNLQVLDEQERDCSLTRSKALAIFNCWCFLKSGLSRKAITVADLLVSRYPADEDALCTSMVIRLLAGDRSGALARATKLQQIKDSAEWRGWKTFLTATNGRPLEAYRVFQQDKKRFEQDLSWLLSYYGFLSAFEFPSSQLNPIRDKVLKLTPVDSGQREHRFWIMALFGGGRGPEIDCALRDWPVLLARDCVPEMDESRIAEFILWYRAVLPAEKLQRAKTILQRYTSWNAYLALGAYEQQEKQPNAALKHFRQSIAKNPYEPTVFLLGAGVLPDEYLSYYDSIVRRENLPVAYHARGEFYEQRQRYESAVRDFEKARALDPAALWSFIKVAEMRRRCEAFARVRRFMEDETARTSDVKFKISQCSILRSMGASAEAARILLPVWKRELDSGVHQSFGRLALELGLSYGDNGRSADALKVYEKALAIDDTPDLLFHYADRLFALGKKDAGIREITKLLTGRNVNPYYYGHRANMFLQEKKYDAALADMKMAFSLEPANMYRAFMIGSTLETAGRVTEAKLWWAKYLDRVLTQEPSAVEYARKLGSEKRYSEAIAIIKPIFAKDPLNTELGLYLAGLYDLIGERRSAGAIRMQVDSNFDAAIRKNGPSVAGYMAKFHIQRELHPQDWLAAVKTTSCVIEIAPTHVAALKERAFLCCNHHDFLQACADYRVLLKAEPQSIETANGLVESCMMTGKYDEALRVADKFLRVAPQHRNLWRVKLCALNILGKNAELEAGLKLCASNGVVYERRVIQKACLEHYRRGTMSDYLGFLGDTRDDEGDILKKLSSVTAKPERARLLCLLGERKAARRRYKEALNRYDEALELAPKDFRILLRRSAVHFAMGERVKSKADRLQALAIYEAEEDPGAYRQ